MSLGDAEESKTRSKKQDGHEDTLEIPSIGIEFYEYRRKLWLAGEPIPPTPAKLLLTYTVSKAPDALELQPRPIPSSIARLARVLADEDSIGSESVWKESVEPIWRLLAAGRRLSKPMPLDLVIKVLRSSWIIDGTWTKDPATGQASIAPDSPIRSGPNTPPSRPEMPFTIDKQGQAKMAKP